MLQPYIPELSPESLVAALKNHNPGRPSTVIAEKPLTRQEAAALLSVSLNSVTRYMNAGLLKRIHIGERTVRIDPQSVRDLLESHTGKEA
jgi:hypothetical protein